MAISAAPAAAASTRAEYVAQVDQICGQSAPGKKLIGEMKRIFGPKSLPFPTSPNPTKEQIRRALNRFINRITRVLAKINRRLSVAVEAIALVPPAPGDEAAVAHWIDGLRKYVANLRASIRALRHHKSAAADKFLAAGEAALNSGGAAVQDFGISVCPTSTAF